MPYIPHTPEDEKQMLATIGASSIDELFRDIPTNLLLHRELAIPSAMDENQLFAHLLGLANQNLSAAKLDWYLGAGLYDRYIPASVGAIISRGEFLTAYTPYQPELSQGYLQTIYEFQTMVAEIYGMDLANASMYDGATAMAEAALLACNVKPGSKVYVSEAVHPSYREVLKTYCWSNSVEIELLGVSATGTTEYGPLENAGCVIVQSPNFFGVIEDLKSHREVCDQNGAMMVVVSDPVACALLKPPGEYGADIVVGEGQPLGVAMGFGGPLVGLFATKTQHIRKIPGRIVGRTQDHQGHDGFVMTLRTREQDIRREKATSNICTNEALMALAATVYMTALGKNGLQSIAETTVRNTQYGIAKLTEAGARVIYDAKVFGEVVLDVGQNALMVQQKLIERGIMPGLPLGSYYPSLSNCLLVAFTENRKKAQIDRFAAELKSVLT